MLARLRSKNVTKTRHIDNEAAQLIAIKRNEAPAIAKRQGCFVVVSPDY